MKRTLRFISVVGMLLFVLQTSYNTVVFVQFKISQSYIVKGLCIQKNEKENHCNGSCYLKAHLYADEITNGAAINYLKDRIDLYCMFLTISMREIEPTKTDYFLNFLSGSPTSHSRDFFHPPA